MHDSILFGVHYSHTRDLNVPNHPREGEFSSRTTGGDETGGETGDRGGSEIEHIKKVTWVKRKQKISLVVVPVTTMARQ